MCAYNACRTSSGETRTLNPACCMSVQVRAEHHTVRWATFPVRF